MNGTVDPKSRLGALIGHWTGTDTIAETRWGPGGETQAECHVQWVLGRTWLAIDQIDRRDGKVVVEAHAMLTWDRDASSYAMLWFDNFGFVPPSCATGEWDDGRLVLVRTSPRGMARHIYDLSIENELATHLENSFDGGTSWSTVAMGRYNRVE
jgi:hypothetical protein